jgi:hypothetical protein
MRAIASVSVAAAHGSDSCRTDQDGQAIFVRIRRLDSTASFVRLMFQRWLPLMPLPADSAPPILGSPLHELTSFYWPNGSAADIWVARHPGGEKSALRQMRKLRAEGASLRAISNNMKAAGVSITHQGVKSALAAADRPAADGSYP